MKDAYYFPHDANARNDEKMLSLLSKNGIQAYGIYWMFIESMHEEPSGKLKCEFLDAYAFQWHVDLDTLTKCYNDAVEIGLFNTDKKRFWSERVLRNKEYRAYVKEARSMGGKKGMARRWGSRNLVITPDNSPITPDNKGNEKKEKEMKEKEILETKTLVPLDEERELALKEKEKERLRVKRKFEKERADAFAEWWATYPRKDDKKKAVKKWEVLFPLGTKEDKLNLTLTNIWAFTERYKKQCLGREKDKIKLPATFLNAHDFGEPPE